MDKWPFPDPIEDAAVSWAVVFIADEGSRERMLERMAVYKDRARAEQSAGDSKLPHWEPRRVRPLGFLD